MLDLEKLIIGFLDSEENKDFIPSMTSVGVTIQIMSIKTKKAIELISELSSLKKIRSEELAIKFLFICNKFELFANYFLLSFKTPHSDLFNLPENSKEWELIRKHLDKKILFSRSNLDKKLEKVFSLITVGMASVSKGFKNKNNSLFNKVIQTGIYMPYFFFFKKNAEIQFQKFAINPDFEVALIIWNLMDCKYIKNLIKITMPNIKHSKKYYLKKEQEELTIDHLQEIYKEFLKFSKSDNYTKNLNLEENKRYVKLDLGLNRKKEEIIENNKNNENDLLEKENLELDEKGPLKKINLFQDDVIISNDNLLCANTVPKIDTFFQKNNIKIDLDNYQSKDEVEKKNYLNNEEYLNIPDETKIQLNQEIFDNQNKNYNHCIYEKSLAKDNLGSKDKKDINDHKESILEINKDLSNKKASTKLIEEKILDPYLHDYVKVRFISSENFVVPQHQTFWSKIVNKKDYNNSPKDSLIIHIHGGGFIAMSSSSHEMYTRKWAKFTDIPIMSIDYRLAPDNPYPKALDDVYQSYLWILKYSEEKLLIKLKNIILVGDSAGGNLTAALTNLLIAKNQRLPTAIFLIYPALRISFTSFSLSMLNVIDDKVLPYHLVKFCLDAYRNDYKIEKDPFISPIYTDDEILKRYPPVKMYVGSNDPLRDDCILFMKKLL